MKKILLLLSLSLLLVVPGCAPAGYSSCTKNGLTPGVTYRIYYTTSSAPDIPGTRVADSNGSITVPSYGYSCSTLQFVAVTNSNVALSASPSSIYLPDPPSTGTITGQGFDTTYGMPKVEYIDSSGYMIGSVYATSVSGGGTSLQANMPNLYNAYSGTYLVKVTNKTSQGYYSAIVGSATITAWGRDRTDSDSDGWYDDEDCAPDDPYVHENCYEYCGGGQEPITVCP